MQNLENIKRIHFIGVGGISMSALAKLMIIKGKTVSGSDINFSEMLTILSELGANVYVGSRIDIVDCAELVVYTGAIKETDEELSFARKNGCIVMTRSKFLAMVAMSYDKVIAISGTHGKTTTTAMLANVFLMANKYFTAHIGGDVKGIGNLVYKGEEYFITEACEYQRAFLEIKSDYTVILNMEKDHPDTYHSFYEIVEAFTEFANNTRAGGKVFLSSDNCVINTAKHLVICGQKEESDYKAANLILYKNGCYGYQIYQNSILKSQIMLNIVGKHNVYNSLFAYAVANEIGIKTEDIVKGIESFRGVKRRFEYKGETNGCKIYIDYAHHPSEIVASIKTAKSLASTAVKVVFQPHTFSRTKELFYDFVNAFEGIDCLYLIPTYKAREEECQGLSSYALYQAMDKDKNKTYYYKNLLGLAKELTLSLKKGEILLILGAGDVDSLTDLIVDYHL